MYPGLLILGFPELSAASHAPPGTGSSNPAKAIIVHVECPGSRNNKRFGLFLFFFRRLDTVGGVRGSSTLRTILRVDTSAAAVLLMQTLVVIVLVTNQAAAS
jgi:hypothetical protein